MTPSPSSQMSADPRHVSTNGWQVGSDGWTPRARTLARRATLKLIEAHPLFALQHPSGQLLAAALIAFHLPATGRLPIRTKNAELMRRCRFSRTTLRRARKDLISAGFIVGYAPGDGARGTGDGGWAGTYVIARTHEEVDTARALRHLPGAPDFPALVDLPDVSMADFYEQQHRERRHAKKSTKTADSDAVSKPTRKPAQQAATQVPPAYEPQQPPQFEGDFDEARERGVAAARAELARRKAEREQQRAS